MIQQLRRGTPRWVLGAGMRLRVSWKTCLARNGTYCEAALERKLLGLLAV